MQAVFVAASARAPRVGTFIAAVGFISWLVVLCVFSPGALASFPAPSDFEFRSENELGGAWKCSGGETTQIAGPGESPYWNLDPANVVQSCYETTCRNLSPTFFTGTGAFQEAGTAQAHDRRYRVQCFYSGGQFAPVFNPTRDKIYERTHALACPPDSTGSTTCTCDPKTLQMGQVCHGGKGNGPSCPSCGNPINPGTANKFESQVVYRGLNGFELRLSYNTKDYGTVGFGPRWRNSFDRRVVLDGTTSAVVLRGDGRALPFTLSGSTWNADAETAERLVELKSGSTRTGWQFTSLNADETETFDAAGKLLTIQSRAGLTQSVQYSDGTGGPNGGFVLDSNGNPTTTPLPAGLLIRASDAFGRTLSFGYDSASRVIRLTDPAGNTYQFSYDASGNVTSITFPGGAVRTFVYNEPANTGGASLVNALTGVIDENSHRFATFKYDAQERAISTEHAAGVERNTVVYNADGTTTVTDAFGSARTYSFQVVYAATKNTAITGALCPTCGPASQTLDANGNIATRTDWNGNRTNYAYDLTRNLETSRTEGLTAGGATTPQSRTITTEWHASFRLPTRIAEPLRITTNVYDADGSSCGARGALCSRSIQATTDADGTQGFSATTVGTARTWTYTYNGNGSVLTINGPRTDVSDITTYAYYANDDADQGKRGNVATITNAVNHITSITAYNEHGQPLTIIDPNGVSTTLTYDGRQRLRTRTVGTEQTTYDYDDANQLTKVTLPDGSYLSYTYDDAHRLTQISDNAGNRINYTLDDMGNRTLEQVFDPASQLAQTRSRVYSNLNRLFQELGAQSQTTEYGYDNQGNVTSVKDPLNHTTTNEYDALNRLKKVTDAVTPVPGVTQYEYNGLDALTKVTDPRTLATLYTVDGLGNLTALTSPDTGGTSSIYDPAGNLTSQTDAKSQTTTYGYDPINRVSLITFQDGSKQTYAYDQGVNGKGRLSSITETDPGNNVTSVIAYGYDDHGRVTTETRTLAGVQYVTGYHYDSSGRLDQLTYPSGRTVNYGFDTLGRVSAMTTTKPGESAQSVVSNVAYHPFGGAKSWTLGNGRQYTRGIDQDGRIASYTLGAKTFAIGYDDASRIGFISDAGDPTNTNTYGYDDVDRLTSAALPGGIGYGYSYDLVGNRATRASGANTDTYAYSSTSNRISSMTPLSGPVRNFTFDLNGSTTADGNNTYGYDTRGRMASATSSIGVTTYQVNALGQRIRKTNSQTDRIFHYDLRGHLIAETDPGGGLKRELIYLGDIPVGVVQ